jgi:uncharacterized protein (TIGR03083 family)
MSERPTTVNDTLARIDRAWDELLAVLDAVPDDRLAEPGPVGAWSVKDLLGHIAVWDRIPIEAVPRLLAGDLTAWEIDTEAINQRESAARRDRSPIELRTEMDAAHAALRAFVAGLTMAAIANDGVRRRIAVDTYEHYAEHAAEIRDWLNRPTT